MPPARVIDKGCVYHGAVQKKQREKCVCSSVTRYITVIECMQGEQENMLSGQNSACV